MDAIFANIVFMFISPRLWLNDATDLSIGSF
jgi:hypothetical protein